jgi:hypothetical protein
MPYTPDLFRFDVFLSYSLKDSTVVRRMAERLRQDGIHVWFDKWEIRVGESIPARIEEGLELSRVLVLCMSANASGSDWTRLEASTFRFRDPLNTERRFIPIRLDDAPIRGSLAQFLYIDWRRDDIDEGYAKLLEACSRPATIPTIQLQTSREAAAEIAVDLHRKGRMKAYAFSTNGELVLTGGEDHTIRLWNVKMSSYLRALIDHTGPINCISWSVDQRRALSGGDNTVRLWDVEMGRCLCVLRGHTGTVSSVAWSADHQRALSGAADATLRIWKVERGDCYRVLNGHAGPILSVAWSTNERFALFRLL